ncbi:hypothetical protein [Exiguobacterium aurantiacum]|uniref:hypothetical protein n=1 Tax=Exiguobacterium aurantiacum TaxID=33987 RepID=UPI00384AA816
MIQNKSCSNCSNIIKSNARYCENCGRPSNTVSPISVNKNKSKTPHFIINGIIGFLVFSLGMVGQDMVRNGVDLEMILFILSLIFIFQLGSFFLQKRQKSYYSLIPIIVAVWLINRYNSGIQALTEYNSDYKTSGLEDKVELMSNMTYVFSLIIVVSIGLMFVQTKKFNKIKKIK